MTSQSGHTRSGPRADEIAEYVEAVRELLPPSQRDELLEDLAAHLAEVAAEDPTPLRERLGSPATYAAELRAAAEPAEPGSGRGLLAERKRQLRERLWQLDRQTGPLLGYERLSDFARLLVPGWWVLRGYLAAMLAVSLLDRQGQIGLLPRLGGSTLAGLLILLVFIAGSVWLGSRAPGLSQWQRRTVYLASGLVVLVGLVGFAELDSDRRNTWTQTRYVSDPYEDVRDVYVVDSDGQLLTDVTLRDQHGRPLDIGWDWCYSSGDDYYDYDGTLVVTYPKCVDELPFWLSTMQRSTATPGPAATPTPTLTPGPAPAAPVTPDPSPSPTPGDHDNSDADGAGS